MNQCDKGTRIIAIKRPRPAASNSPVRASNEPGIIPMLVFNSNTKKNKLVKTKSTNFIKITAFGLAMASFLALAFLLHYMSMHSEPITADIPLLQATSGDINGTSSYGTAGKQSNQTRHPHMKDFITELQPDSPYMTDSAVFGSTLLYTTTIKPFSEKEPIEFALSATDSDGDQLVYSASNLPEGASFNSNNQTFSWTPRYDQAGVYTVHFEVSDGELSDSEDVTITVVQLYEDWDVNGDGTTNVLDMVLIGQHWGETGLTGWIREDANEDGSINVLDIIIIGQNWTG